MRTKKRIRFTVQNGNAVKYVYTDGTESTWVPVRELLPGDSFSYPKDKTKR